MLKRNEYWNYYTAGSCKFKCVRNTERHKKKGVNLSLASTAIMSIPSVKTKTTSHCIVVILFIVVFNRCSAGKLRTFYYKTINQLTKRRCEREGKDNRKRYRESYM